MSVESPVYVVQIVVVKNVMTLECDNMFECVLPCRDNLQSCTFAHMLVLHFEFAGQAMI